MAAPRYFNALDDLCLHPKYTTALQDEIYAVAETNPHTPPKDLTSYQDLTGYLALLNGFLKESARLKPTDSISLRRKVLQPLTLNDGTSLATNDIACIPLQPILQEPETYADPLTFNPTDLF
ncbi:uncharacterized protein BO97DRAFT_422799 [Aspergillus homomorphus CBS 101889]|uniref:Uncharacterized protein n=1 Tax=Aspergillus homomorphus (strain CBS 101889) TaxID=1450537 RepID=A0A395I2H9_ASPHC|nr:hypothetical protein BO97DRAFT_422799 [Aspergillus homomorphus CBS 101889]RAL14382.1 hypothetical protein BO97DRAFT_422799 [Aspergillus homomorphus CBS 101889]